MSKRWFRYVLPAVFGLALAANALPAGATHPAADHVQMKLHHRSPTGATNSDLAFWGDLAIQGDYGGFRIFDISDPRSPDLVSNTRCFGPQNDVSVWDGLLVLSIDRTLTGPRCGSGITAHDDPSGWEGLRIFDISDPANPDFIKGVYQDCGSHTNTLLPRVDRGDVLIYNQSYPLRPGPTCGPDNGPPNGQDPLHGKIQIVRIPLANPAKAHELTELPINYPGDSDNLFDPQEHGLPEFAGPPTPSNRLNDLRACHDLSLLLDAPPGLDAPNGVAAGACAEQAQIYRLKPNGIADTTNPIWIFDDNTDETGITGDPNDPGVAVEFWHSATFTWDGEVVNFSDESFADDCPPTTEAYSADTGRTFFFDLATGDKLSHFMIPRPEPGAYCSTHQGNVVPTDAGYFMVQAWYMGGAGIVDFTDPANPVEVAYWDFNPDGATGSDNWSHYWYEGPDNNNTSIYTYATDGVHNPPTGRGFEVFESGAVGPAENLDYLNPQTQEDLLFP